LGHYLLIADDGTEYNSNRDWQPMLHPYQKSGSNLLYLFTINATQMPKLPPAFINLAKTRGTGKPGSVPKGTTIIAALGGETYSQKTEWWKFLTGSASDARAMGKKIAEWKKYGIDGIDLDIEQGIGDVDVGANIVEMIKGIKGKEPTFIITNPKDGYPSCKATNYLVNHAWDAQSKPLGILDRVSVMYYTCEESLNYVKNYASDPKPYQGFPITVPVPTNNIIVGIGGADNADCITGLAVEIKSRDLGGMMVWFSSVIDAATNATAITYTNQYDSAVAKASTWADALKILQSTEAVLV
jgi:chitinase